jgi:hypothetical protein
LAPLDLKGRRDRKDPSERKVQPATGARPARPGHRGKSAPKVRKANPDRKDLSVLLVSAAKLARRVLRDHPDLKEILVPPPPCGLLLAPAQSRVATTSSWSRLSA